MNDLRPIVQQNLKQQRARMRVCRNQGKLTNFREGDFVLVARDVFHEGEKLCLRWRGPRHVIKALSDYTFQVENLRNGTVSDIHGTRLKFYHDPSIDTTAIISHVLTSETGIPVARLMRPVEENGKLMVAIRWKELSEDDDSLEPIARVFQDVPDMLRKLLRRKNMPDNVRSRAIDELGL